MNRSKKQKFYKRKQTKIKLKDKLSIHDIPEFKELTRKWSNYLYERYHK